MGRILIENIDKIHTTPMGVDRIKRNLLLDDSIDVIERAKSIVRNKNANIVNYPPLK